MKVGSRTSRSPKIVFVHGYGTDITSFFQHAEGKNKGFHFLDPLIKTGQAASFNWSLPYTLSWWQAVNPWLQSAIYFAYRAQLQDPSLYLRLQAQLYRDQPQLIIAHSLGCQLIIKYLESYPLPPSVKHLVFIQADVDRVTSVRNILTAHAYTDVTVTNYYCPWDFPLLMSSLYHFHWRAGVWGLVQSHPQVQNFFLPATKRGNYHTSALRDKRTWQKITSQLRIEQ